MWKCFSDTQHELHVWCAVSVVQQIPKPEHQVTADGPGATSVWLWGPVLRGRDPRPPHQTTQKWYEYWQF